MDKKSALSQLMIRTLLAACEKQQRGIAFGPADMDGSFGALIERGLVVNTGVFRAKGTIAMWRVTDEAIDILKAYGFDVLC